VLLNSGELQIRSPELGFPQRQLWTRPIAWALITALAYYAGCRLGFAFTFNPRPISVLWPPNAILMSALLLAPRRNWLLILALVFPAHLVVQLRDHVPLSMALCWYFSNSVEACIGAFTVWHALKRPLRFHSLHETSVFMLYAVITACFVSSFVDVALVKAIGWGHGTYWELWQIRMMSNTTATLTILPFVLCCSERLAAGRLVPRGRAGTEFLMLAAGLVAACVLAFDAAPTDAIRPFLLYLPIPFLIWAALRFGPSGSSTIFVLVVGAVIWGASNGRGPFIGGSSREVDVLDAQLFLQLVGTMLLFLASGVREREAASAQLTHISRLAVLGELTASIAHEVNQPLTSIGLNAKTIETLLDAHQAEMQDVREALADIRSASARAGDVVSHLRSLIRRRELTIENLNINEIIRDVLEIVRFDLSRYNITVQTQLAAVRTISGDAIHIQQVLLNLIFNAVDGMKDMRVGDRVVKLMSSDTSDGKVCVSVLDSGPGIPVEAAGRLFEAFYTTKKDGMGLGLPIARTIVEAHGGSIHAANNCRQGARLYFFLPVARRQRESHNSSK
jgi:signal transduction histidine kinase